jgi:hypothetical protein
LLFIKPLLPYGINSAEFFSNPFLNDRDFNASASALKPFILTTHPGLTLPLSDLFWMASLFHSFANKFTNGPATSQSAPPALRKTVNEALDNGCNSLRDAVQFLFAALPNLAGGNAATEPAFPMDQG